MIRNVITAFCKQKKEIIINQDFIFGIFFVLYNLALLVETVFIRGIYWHNGVPISDSLPRKIILLSIISIVGYIAARVIMSYIPHRKKKINEINSNYLTYTVWIVFSVTICILFVYYYVSDGLFNNYDKDISTYYNKPIFSYARESFIFSCSMILYMILNIKKNILFGFVFSLFMIFLAYLSKDKDVILLTLIPWLPATNKLLKRINICLSIKYIIISFTILIVLPIAGYLFSSLTRSNDSLNDIVERIDKYGVYRNFDNSGPFYSLIDNLSEENIDYKYGESYLNGSLFWIPQFVWKDRPKSLSDEYARKRITDWKPGQGLGYNLMGMAYINFGYFGGFIQYFLIAFLLFFLERITFKIFRGESEGIIYGLFYIWLIYNLVTMHRGEFSLPSTFIRYILPFIAVFYTLKMSERFLYYIRVKIIR